MNTLHFYGGCFGKYGSVGANGYSGVPFTSSSGNSYIEILTKKLGLELKNRSKTGASNFTVFEHILNDNENGFFKEGDTVFWELTDTSITWTSIGTDIQMNVIPDQILKINPKIMVLRNMYYKFFYNEQQAVINAAGFIYYLKSVLKCKFYFSFLEDFERIKRMNPVVFNSMITDKSFISSKDMSVYQYVKSLPNQESLFFYPYDMIHPSIEGHKIMADVYYKAIQSKTL